MTKTIIPSKNTNAIRENLEKELEIQQGIQKLINAVKLEDGKGRNKVDDIKMHPILENEAEQNKLLEVKLFSRTATTALKGSSWKELRFLTLIIIIITLAEAPLIKETIQHSLSLKWYEAWCYALLSFALMKVISLSIQDKFQKSLKARSQVGERFLKILQPIVWGSVFLAVLSIGVMFVDYKKEDSTFSQLPTESSEQLNSFQFQETSDIAPINSSIGDAKNEKSFFGSYGIVFLLIGIFFTGLYIMTVHSLKWKYLRSRDSHKEIQKKNADLKAKFSTRKEQYKAIDLLYEKLSKYYIEKEYYDTLYTNK